MDPKYAFLECLPVTSIFWEGTFAFALENCLDIMTYKKNVKYFRRNILIVHNNTLNIDKQVQNKKTKE